MKRSTLLFGNIKSKTVFFFVAFAIYLSISSSRQSIQPCGSISLQTDGCVTFEMIIKPGSMSDLAVSTSALQFCGLGFESLLQPCGAVLCVNFLLVLWLPPAFQNHTYQNHRRVESISTSVYVMYEWFSICPLRVSTMTLMRITTKMKGLMAQ